MASTQDIIKAASSLPVEDRVIVVDSLLRTLNTPIADIDKAWAETARQRLAELRAGRTKPVPGEIVFERIRERFSK